MPTTSAQPARASTTQKMPLHLLPWPRFRHLIRARSEVRMAAPAATVWQWLIQAERWREWYDDAPAIDHATQPGAPLRAGSVVNWRSRGLLLTATVEEYVPGQRLSWRVRGAGLRGRQRWLLRETATGCQVVTEQVQTGWRSVLRELLRPHALLSQQHCWLLALRRQVLHGAPPYLRPAAPAPGRGQLPVRP